MVRNKVSVLLVAANSAKGDKGFLRKAAESAHALPPLGILYVATYLQKYGWGVAVLDAGKDYLTEEETVEYACSKICDGGFLGWSVWVNSVDAIERMSFAVKYRRPDIRQFIGGPHMSASPLDTMRRLCVSIRYGVVGEGEMVTPKLLSNWGDDKYLESIPGIVICNGRELMYMRDKRYGYRVISKKISEYHNLSKGASDDELLVEWPLHAERIEDLDQIEIPNYELLGSLEPYHLSDFTPPVGESQMSLITSRGCPYACSFCDQEVSGHKWRGMSPTYIIRHIKYLMSLGVDYFYFTDDVFLVDLMLVRELVELIILDKDLNDIRWEAITRVDLVNKASKYKLVVGGDEVGLLEALAYSGCVQLHIAPETGSERLRYDAVFKRIKNQEVVEAVRHISNAGISVKLLNMVGLPGEVLSDTLDTLRFIKLLGDNGASYAMVSVYTPLPHTPIAYLIERGLVEWTGDINNWSSLLMGSTVDQFLTDIYGVQVDSPTSADVLNMVAGKYRIGPAVTQYDVDNGLRVEDKIRDVVEFMVRNTPCKNNE